MKNTLIISDTHSDCQEFIGALDKDGYGIERFEGKQSRAHRNAFRRKVGEIPDGMLVCHSCDNPCCINPDHLFLGTVQDNMSDKVSKNRQHKPKGDLNGMSKLTESNVRIIKSLLREGRYSHTEIAGIFDCYRQAITLINTGDRWGHVE